MTRRTTKIEILSWFLRTQCMVWIEKLHIGFNGLQFWVGKRLHNMSSVGIFCSLKHFKNKLLDAIETHTQNI